MSIRCLQQEMGTLGLRPARDAVWRRAGGCGWYIGCDVVERKTTLAIGIQCVCNVYSHSPWTLEASCCTFSADFFVNSDRNSVFLHLPVLTQQQSPDNR